MPRQVEKQALFDYFGAYGEVLDEMSETLSGLYDEGRRCLPPAVEEWHRLTGQMIREYDLQRYGRESDKAADARARLAAGVPGGGGISEVSDGPGDGGKQ